MYSRIQVAYLVTKSYLKKFAAKRISLTIKENTTWIQKTTKKDFKFEYWKWIFDKQVLSSFFFHLPLCEFSNFEYFDWLLVITEVNNSCLFRFRWSISANQKLAKKKQQNSRLVTQFKFKGFNNLHTSFLRGLQLYVADQTTVDNLKLIINTSNKIKEVISLQFSKQKRKYYLNTLNFLNVVVSPFPPVDCAEVLIDRYNTHCLTALRFFFITFFCLHFSSVHFSKFIWFATKEYGDWLNTKYVYF